MKKTQIKRLSLSRETLRRLDLEKEGYLQEAAGGTGSGCEDTCITSRNPLCTIKP